MASSRRLIVNADDFGFTRDVNAGIAEACEKGILRAATLMANGAAFDDAVRLAKAYPRLDVGAHLVLVGGESVAEPGRPLPRTLGALARKVALGWRAAQIEREFEAQIRKILAAGVEISHLDAHKHTHLLPPVLKAMVGVARRHKIIWIRRPFDVPLTAAAQTASARRRLANRLLRPLDRHFERTLDRARLRATDYFAGFQLTGSYRESELAELIRSLPPGLGELMTHPGRCTAELRATDSRLKESREIELRALTSREAREAVAETGVELVDFRMAGSEFNA